MPHSSLLMMVLRSLLRRLMLLPRRQVLKWSLSGQHCLPRRLRERM
ncbi:hypothetical protein RSOL_397240 [Rhizoctonia solani AG-3 Rhs1AP]|uniref:Uncharacterized protein n=1 Tax=Rhizoctonia solani AG-3 Rhs1AP TaxID=1086054 RepID=X8JE27_9AGAM|nr:hypothetical protein RSOL_397240 [Rhizoctonia solani AG-3 Rhs1AP]